MKELGVYIHIPFCKQKCLYCDFISFAQKEEMQEKYVEAIKKEINNWHKQNENFLIKTIYSYAFCFMKNRKKSFFYCE